MKKNRKTLVLFGVVVMVFVFAQITSAADWYVPVDFATIQEAINASNVNDGDMIRVSPGNHAGAYLDKSLEIKGEGDAIIDSGPSHSSGLSMGFRLLEGSDGATINHLTFTVDLAIMNGAAVDDVTVTQCTFLNTVQAVSQWSGCGWEITHNEIIDLKTRNGGGIGILVADWSGGIVENNVVSHNKISGTLFPGGACAKNDPDCELGGYDGSGIVIYADFRWDGLGAAAINYNRVVKNKVSLLSDDSTVVDVNAFELTENYYPDEHPGDVFVIIDNTVVFNDFRGTESQILIYPEVLNDFNDISRNLGETRGLGPYPSVFGPGG